jgi:hypothetical protein
MGSQLRSGRVETGETISQTVSNQHQGFSIAVWTCAPVSQAKTRDTVRCGSVWWFAQFKTKKLCPGGAGIYRKECRNIYEFFCG